MPGKRKEAREQALGLLLTGMSQRDVAGVVGVSERAVWGWLQEPGFRKRLQRRQAVVRQRIYGQMVEAGQAALDNLIDKIGSEDESISLRASLAVLDRIGFRATHDPNLSDEERAVQRSREELIQRVLERAGA